MSNEITTGSTLASLSFAENAAGGEVYLVKNGRDLRAAIGSPIGIASGADVEALKAAQSGGVIGESTWERLITVEPGISQPIGAQADIPQESDSGSHVDPIKPGNQVVRNYGRFVRRTDAPDGWEWLREDTLVERASLRQIGMSYETIGRPENMSPVAGSTASANRVVFGNPVSADCQLARLRCYVPVASRMVIASYSRSGNVFTRTGEIAVALAVGLNDMPLASLPEFFVAAGSYIGFSCPHLQVLNGTAGDGLGYWSGASYGLSFSATDSSLNTINQIQLGLGFSEIPKAEYLNGKFSASRSLATDIGRGADFRIGKGLPFTAASPNADRTYVLGQPAPSDGLLRSMRVYGLAAGTVQVKLFDKADDLFTQSGDAIPVGIATGEQTIVFGAPICIKKGQYVGFYATSGALTNVSDAENYIGYYDNFSAGGGNASSFSDSGLAAAVCLQIAFNFTAMPDGSLLRIALNRIEQVAETGGDPLEATAGYILVWAIGQSNTSGRSLALSSKTFTAGQAYKYVRNTNALELMADPTGNDATAAAGRGSWGPAFADTIRRLSAGRIGVILVNSAEGGTPLSPNWLTGGTQWSRAVTDLDSALAAAATAELPIVGACVYMQQGETDADNATSTTDYISRFTSLKAQCDAKLGSKVPFLMTRIGTKNTGDTAEYANIRAAQNQIADTIQGVYLVHTGAQYFASRGLMMDTFHYVIGGYEEIGDAAGNAAFGLALGARPLTLD
ncbi:sialate O-acetylesterase [Stenotrophomonas sp. MMGLT7]|uniref:sialate O-acetylesterase n=1 Tax=Stenotrophomonas sp. MMGLT7 TaxID=2901227 RepID=UPI001E47B32C|nr:sialate O-acetylesterase [Stenotrophomonas sp. MMGLT7]MCD7099129.1 sialate O-acetylesterase [Stenotrophomonas sp. MMGLT7]